jgi:FG-GAP repeat protein
MGQARRRTSPTALLPLAVALSLFGGVGPARATGDTGADGPSRPSRSPQRHLAAEFPVVDFNGDGYADLAVEALYEDIGTVPDAGAVNVLYGSATGMQADAPDDQFWSQDSDGVPGTAETGDQFGFAMGQADFNSDGYTDLAMGVPFEDIGSIDEAGLVDVLYGSASGLQVTSPPAQQWDQDTASVKGTAEAFDQFGRAVAAADFNGDGFADLAVGVPREDIGAVDNAGRVNVLYGSAAGLQATSPDDQDWNQDSPNVADQSEQGDVFGRHVAASDFNADGYADLAIGGPFEGIGSIHEAGGLNVLYGSAAGLQTDSPADQFWAQDSPGVKDDPEKTDFFARAVAAGDFNDDGFNDLAIGVRLEDIGTIRDAGAVEVLFGSAAGLQADLPDDQFWIQGGNGLAETAEPGDQFGFHLSTGDYNGDGFADLAVGAAFEDIKAKLDAGVAQVLYGTVLGLQADAPNDQLFKQTSLLIPGDTSERGDNFACATASLDFNDDGFTDLALGAVKEDLPGLVDAGAVDVIYGSATGLQITSPAAQFWTQDSPGVEDEAEAGDEMGWSASSAP